VDHGGLFHITGCLAGDLHRSQGDLVYPILSRPTANMIYKCDSEVRLLYQKGNPDHPTSSIRELRGDFGKIPAVFVKC